MYLTMWLVIVVVLLNLLTSYYRDVSLVFWKVMYDMLKNKIMKEKTECFWSYLQIKIYEMTYKFEIIEWENIAWENELYLQSMYGCYKETERLNDWKSYHG